MLLLVVAALWIPSSHSLGYRSDNADDADFLIGAILPLTKPGCKEVNPEGIVFAEAFVHGYDLVKGSSQFKALRAKQSVGYDIRDNCGEAVNTRIHAHDIAGEALDYKKDSKGKKPVDVVISAFTNDDISSLAALEGEEILAAASYAPDNARLSKTAENQYKIGKLVSVYPEESKKVLVVADIIEKFNFKYVYAVTDDNVEGDAAIATLKEKLAADGVCVEELEGDAAAMVKQIASNDLVNVVVVSLPEAEELALYQELENNSITDLTIITTQGYENDVSKLNDFTAVVDGGLDIFFNRNSKTFKDFLRAKGLPYAGREWLQEAVKSFGGNESCLTAAGKGGPTCEPAKDKVQAALVANADDAEYAYQAVLAMAYAQMKALETKEPFLDVVRGLDVDVQELAVDPVSFSEDLSASIDKFVVMNLQLKGKAINSKYMGLWDESNAQEAFNIRGDLKWSGNSKVVPTSVCSAACAPGSVRKFKDGQCCWNCEKCPNGTVSNVSNAKECHTCPEGEVVRPDQSGCKAYELNYFEWFGGVGAVIIVLMVIGFALVLFGLGVFSQNSQHEVVVNANYNSLCVFLFALVLLILSPVPLLVKTPSGGACSAYIFMFNMGVSVVLGVLMSRSAWLNGFFDENGELTKGTLGRYPRTACVVGVAVIQLLIMIISFSGESILTLHNLTDVWDQRYHECSSWASSTFWAGFTYNIIVSVVGNSMSCSSIKIEDNVYELKYILLGHLMWYLWGLVDLIIFHRSNDENLAGGQAMVALLMAITFFIVYPWPKMYAILFQSKGGKLIPQEEEEEDEEAGVITDATAISSAAGFTGAGIVSVKIREE